MPVAPPSIILSYFITDTSACHCRDLLTGQRTLTYTIDENRSTTFTDCPTLADLAPELCNSLRDRKCCASCVGGKDGENEKKIAKSVPK